MAYMPALQGYPECRRLPYLFQGVLIFSHSLISNEMT